MATTPKKRKKRSGVSTQEYIMRFVNQWLANNPAPNGKIDLDALAQHFIDEGIIDDPKVSKIKRYKQVISRAMSRYRIHDDELGEVRPIYAVMRKSEEGQTEWDWAHGPTCPPPHALASLRGRYNSAEARLQHIEADKKYYEKINIYGAELPPFDYNFNRLFEEKKLADEHGGDYPDEKPNA